MMKHPVDVQNLDLLDQVPVGVFILSSNMTVLFWNRSMETWSGVARDDILWKDLCRFYPHLLAPRYMSRIRELFNGGAPAVFSSQIHKHFIPCHLPGDALRVQYTVATALPDGSGGFNALFSIQDVTALTRAIENHRLEHERLLVEMEERRKAEEELKKYARELQRLNRILAERAIRDGLTGLYNHRHFYQLLRRDFLLAHRHGNDIACLLVDLDFFKKLNDTYGHTFGDRVLKGVAKVLQDTVRETDVVARYGGEEFAVLLPSTGLEGALLLAESIRKSVERRIFRLGPVQVNTTASIGVATLRTHRIATPPDLVEAADRGLYAAKAAGRNTVCVIPEENAASNGSGRA